MTKKVRKRLSKVLLTLSLSLMILLGNFTNSFFAVNAANTTNNDTGFRSDAYSAEDSLRRANDLNEKIMEEGIVMLKNQNNVLPMASGSKVTVLGKSSVNPLYGGAGSSSGGAAIYNLFDSLTNAGLSFNTEVKKFYENKALSGEGRPVSGGVGQLVNATGETPISSYPVTLETSYSEYDDAAIIFLTRVGGEGFDLSTSNIETRTDKSEHYLELDVNEKDLIDYASEHFDKVIVVLNISTSFELGDLEASDKVDSILWMGLPGGTGLNALGRVLNGEVNPSGRTVDTYAADFTADPTFANFANNASVGNQYKNDMGENANRHFVEYEEGIYVGYRYYETRGFVAGEEWYESNVIYPFGYGLSYTTFSWDVTFPEVTTFTKDTVVSVSIEVTNTGSVAGKDVVQLYASAPYTAGEIEKSHVVLAGFAKTKLLEPNESETIIIDMPIEVMASYDYNDANKNGFKGYEVEEGEYTLYVGKNAHDSWKAGSSKQYTISSDILLANDKSTGYKVENQFDDVSAYFGEKNVNVPFSGKTSLMSREDFEGTFPTSPTAQEIKLSSDELLALQNPVINASFDANKPWYTDEMPQQASTRLTEIKLKALIGKDYDDPLWEEFLNQLTIGDLANFVAEGFFTTSKIDDLGIPESIMPDGPTGYVGNMAGKGEARCFYVAPIVVSSTWNVELAKEQGEVMGEEGLWMGYGGIYAPATNTHRTPFSGRNFEYYSEDGLLAGKICANVVSGIQSKGIVTMVKHFAVNDQETNRDTHGLVTWADEQTMREIYFKSFEYAVKEGGSMGMMSSFNRLGTTWAGGSYALLTEVLRNEWGFKGAVITDWAQGGYMNQNQMIRAGNDFYLGMKFGEFLVFGKPSTAQGDLTATHVTAMRNAAKNVLYVVANSAAMNNVYKYSDEFTASGKHIGAYERGQAVNFDASTQGFGEVEYVLYNAPKGLSIDKNTGVISGTIADDAEIKAYNAYVAIRDDEGYMGQFVELPISVHTIIYTGEDISVKVGESIDKNIATANIKNATYSAQKLPAGLSLSKDGKLTGKFNNSGSYSILVTVEKENFISTTTIFNIDASLQKITYKGENIDVVSNATISKNLATADVKDATYSAIGLPHGLSLSANGMLTGAIINSGKFTFKVIVAKNGYETVETTFTLNVSLAKLTLEGKDLNAKAEKSFVSDIANPDITGVVYTATGLPEGLSLSKSGMITGTPTESGTFDITVTAEKEGYESTTATFRLVIEQADVTSKEPSNVTPVVLGSVGGVVVGGALAAGVFLFLKRKTN